MLNYTDSTQFMYAILVMTSILALLQQKQRSYAKGFHSCSQITPGPGLKTKQKDFPRGLGMYTLQCARVGRRAINTAVVRNTTGPTELSRPVYRIRTGSFKL